MSPGMKTIAAVGLLLAVAGISGSLLALEPGQWTYRYRDPACTSSTSVDLYDPSLDTLNILWEAPDPRDGYLPSFAPLVHCFEDNQGNWVQMVVVGTREEGKVLDAWSGLPLAMPEDFPAFGWREYSPYWPPEDWYAIDAETDVFVTLQADGVEAQFKVVAYDLRNWAPLWTCPVTGPVSKDICAVAAKNGIVYLVGYAFNESAQENALGVVAIDESTGTVKWEISLPGYDFEAHLPAVGRPPGETEDWVFLGVLYDGVAALYPDPANPGGRAVRTWPIPGVMTAPSFDESTGWVFITNRISFPDGPTMRHLYFLNCLDARSGETRWQVEIADAHGTVAPSLGVVCEEAGIATPAVFAVGRRDVFAFCREDGRPLWQWTADVELSRRSTFAGGKLYVDAENARYYSSGDAGEGETFVLDANTGECIETLDTSGRGNWGALETTGGRAVVEVRDPQGVPRAVMYYVKMRSVEAERYVAAVSVAGQDPPPQSGVIALTVEPQTIGYNSSATITATYEFGVAGAKEPMAGVAVRFSCDAPANVGTLSAGSAITDEQGRASVTFNSLKRSYVVTVTASARFADPKPVAITITRNAPPTTGTISGTVYAAGKAVKGASVTATNQATGQSMNATTDAKGKYSLAGLPVGLYLVEAFKSGVGSDAVANVQVQGGQTTTVNLDLKP